MRTLEKRNNDICLYLTKNFNIIIFLSTNVQLHVFLRRVGGNSMDIQLVIVSLIVLAAVVYIVWRAKKARKGQCSCGCGGCGKSCKPKTL